MAARRPRSDGAQVDVDMQSLPAQVAAAEVASHLQVKGFCVLRPILEQGAIEKALVELKQFEAAGRWHRVNQTVQDGLLGQEGSASIAELENPELASEVRSDGESLTTLDESITEMHFSLEEHLEFIGVHVSHRTLGVVHQAGEPDEDEVPHTEKQVMKWLSQFMRHRLMVLIFLGPTSGMLELKPYETEDTEVHQVSTPPGTMVVLRPDLMSHRHFAPGRSFVLSSFFLAAHINKRVAHAMTPSAAVLDEWTLNRLRQLKESDREDAVWDPEIPRDWQHAMNHMYHKGQMIAVRGAAFKAPVCEDPEVFWMASTAAPDYVVDIPISRWDHSQVFDDEPESWRQYKSYCHHAAFMEGIEMFDCKFFNLTANEAKTMDPHQRLILEVGYGALANMGMRKGTLTGTATGVYVGCGNTEWSVADKEMDFGAFGATGGALSISSGRFSFILGLKGPSMTLDTEASSGATALYLAAESCQKKGRAAANDMSVAIAAHLLLTPLWWPSQCASGWLSRRGRCLSFDATADGYTRCDGVAAAGVKCLNTVVDGQVLSHEDEPLIGSIAGAMMNNNGVGAALAAPHGPAEQEAIAEALRNASISPCDVDGIEGHMAGTLLADAVEVGSLVRALRSEDMDEPLPITGMKSSVGNQVEVGALAAFVRSLYSLQWGNMTPNLHLRQVNPHMDAFDTPCALVTECLEYRMTSAFVGVMSRGFGGSNVFLLGWGQVDEGKLPTEPSAPPKDSIYFWPGGGGELDKDQQPQMSYKLAGSWNAWATPLTMEAEDDGLFGRTVTLGENRWEQFQIWLDGDAARALHPGQPKASKDTPAFGPADDALGCNWIIDGRGALGDAELARGSSLSTIAACSLDDGLPGDQYRVRLRVAGKWRSVTWEKLPAAALLPGISVQPTFQLGTYFIAGTWNNWAVEEMEADPARPGFFSFVVAVRGSEKFQILRNSDWEQVLYPGERLGSADGSTEVLGPDDQGHGLNFCIDGSQGSRYRVELQRLVERDKDIKKVSWRILRNE